MAKGDLIPKDDNGFVSQMLLFKNNIGKHAAALGVAPEQVAAQAADAAYWEYIVNAQRSIQMASKSWTAAKKSVRYGNKQKLDTEQMETLAFPVLPDPAPPTVTFGVESRFRELVQQIKRHANYRLDIGKELGIEAVDHAAPDFTTIAPALTARVSGDHVELGWNWLGKRAFLEQCELQVDRDDGRGFVILSFSTRSRFVDKTPFPAKPTRRAYRAIYHAGDKAVGQWSNIASVLVPG